MPRLTVKAGFLPLYLKLYEDISPGGYEQYTPFIEEITSLIESSGISVVNPGVTFDTAHIKRAQALFEKEGISFIILLHLSYSPSLLVADFLQELKVPILLVDTTLTPSFNNMDSEYLIRNHGIHGVMDLTSVMKSRGVDFLVMAGHRTEEIFQEKLKRTLTAIKGAVLYKNQNIGITGKPFIGMGDFSVDFDELHKQFGITVKDIPLSRIIEEEKSVIDGDIDTGIEEDKKFWDVSGVAVEVHREAVRTSLALKKIMADQGLTGYTMNFQYITGDIPTPFYACSQLMSEGYGYGGEGDVLTATLGFPLNQISSAAKFDEFFCADWMNDLILMSHMGESDRRFVKSGSSPSLAVRDGFVNPKESAIYRFQAEPGEVTFVNLCPAGRGHYRMVAGLLDIVDSHVFDHIKAPHYMVNTRIPVDEFLERYAEAGGGHHLYIARGNILNEIRIFAGLLGFEFITI